VMYHIVCKFGFGEGREEKWLSYMVEERRSRAG
jgi:hypothetical protein